MKLTKEIVRELFHYDPEAGKLFWKKRDPKWFTDGEGRFSAQSQCDSWNTRFAGKEASPKLSDTGYTRIHFWSRTYAAHRLIWLYHFGFLPKEIDHINGDRADNRLFNLRSVTPEENMRNKVLYRNNRSGVTGVNWEPDRKKWSAKIRGRDGLRRLGCFSRFEDAVAARKAAEKKHGFHPNHGRTR